MVDEPSVPNLTIVSDEHADEHDLAKVDEILAPLVEQLPPPRELSKSEKLRAAMTPEHKQKMAEGRARRREADAQQKINDEEAIESAKQRAATLLEKSEIDKLELGEVVTAYLLDLLVKGLSGQIRVGNAKDLKAMIDTLHAVKRLEAGQPTSISGAVDRKEVIGQIREIHERAKRSA